ncbi:MAG: PQQ-dependent sugar dehydrogenase, partial [Chloroflexi bacterium]|nr:PQQ-dependent sugar dehydrogenase [Chloroflexota bacterium]
MTGGLEAPTDIAVRSAAPGDLYVVEQAGRIRIVRDGRLLDEPLLDIADRVTAGGEQGLLGLAFEPAQNGQRLFVYYTSLDGPQVLASFRTSARDPDRVDPNTEDVLLKMADPFGNHNGGGLAF